MENNNLMFLLKNNKWDEIYQKEITSEDIDDFDAHYQQLNELIHKYNHSITNRNKLKDQIMQQAELLQAFTDLFKSRMIRLKTHYELVNDKFSDIKKTTKIIELLANEKKDEYSILHLQVQGIASFENAFGDKESDLMTGKVILVGLKEILNKIPNDKPYWNSEIKEMINRIFSTGSSVIVATNYYYIGYILPSTYDQCNSTLVKLNASPNDIVCYLRDNDEITKAVNKLELFIQENGADFNGIDDYTIFETIRNVQEPNQKKYEINS